MKSRKMIVGIAAAVALGVGTSPEGLAEDAAGAKVQAAQQEEAGRETELETQLEQMEAGQEAEAESETQLEQTEAGQETETEPETQTAGEMDCEALGTELSKQMAAGNFAGTEELFTEDVKAQLPEAVLKMAWGQTVAKLGAYQEVYETQQTMAADGISVKVTLRYENGGLNVLFAFNGEKKISGLWLNYYNIPEEPEAAPEYQEQEIKIGEYELEGRLMLPEGAQNPPVVILVQGSGQSDMNETVGAAENQPFRDLAVGLAKRGIATIRYNKRYYQYPEKAPLGMTIQDEVLDDVDSAIAFARECGQTDPERIFVLGHSLGGMLVPKIAADHEEVAGIISMAGSPRSLLDIMVDQNEEVLENAADISQEEKDQMLADVKKMAEQAREAAQDDTEAILNAPGAYWYSLNQINAGELAKGLEIPMLFLQGDADFQVYPDKDFALWQELLEGKENVSFHLYEGLNHLFMPTSGKRDVTEYDTKDQVEEQVLDDIAAWLK